MIFFKKMMAGLVRLWKAIPWAEDDEDDLVAGQYIPFAPGPKNNYGAFDGPGY